MYGRGNGSATGLHDPPVPPPTIHPLKRCRMLSARLAPHRVLSAALVGLALAACEPASTEPAAAVAPQTRQAPSRNVASADGAFFIGSVNDQSASTFTTNVVIPFGFEATECGNETVVVSGRVHLVMHGTISSSGNVHAVVHVNPQNIRGFGVTTGTQYLAPGMLQTVTNMNGPAPVTETFVNNFELIGQGAAPDFMLHQNLHLTVNANGEITAAFDHFTSECK